MQTLNKSQNIITSLGTIGALFGGLLLSFSHLDEQVLQIFIFVHNVIGESIAGNGCLANRALHEDRLASAGFPLSVASQNVGKVVDRFILLEDVRVIEKIPVSGGLVDGFVEFSLDKCGIEVLVYEALFLLHA